ncbi:hypothetical protein SZ64_07335 [Erythrobacter sp. SG61-1L]|nr:hypothetical protein SZ64_07335 [Erythrobacter sp. SG61-1L]
MRRWWHEQHAVSHAHSGPTADAYAVGNPDPDTEWNAYADSWADPNSDTRTYAYADSWADPNSDTGADPDPNADSDSDLLGDERASRRHED